MGYYAIGIGGTGAKCLESLIHLAAAGMMPTNRNLHVLFVDPDNANGSLTRAKQTLESYVTCQKTFEFGQTDLLQTEIVPAEPVHWNPFTNQPSPSLGQSFYYDILRGSPAGKLFQVLYSRTERTSPLQEGFRGHPSIGSAVMAKTVDLRENETWKKFYNQMAGDDEGAKVFLAGSIFGGTGASGFPTIAQLIKNNVQVDLGGALVLPYFKFTSNDDNKLKAKSDEFLMNTQAALKYYHLWNRTGVYDAVYLFGDESRAEVENALGGPQQQNVPHFIELYAALAAIDFFRRDLGTNQDAQYFVTARAQHNLLQWTDLPDGNKGNAVRSKIGQLARFAFAYLSVYRQMLQEIHNNERGGSDAPWFIEFFKRSDIENDQTLLNDVRDYCEAFLLWLANLQENRGETEKIELVEYRTYARKREGNSPALELRKNDNNSVDFTPQGFSNLMYPQKEENRNALHELWERMCNSRRKGRDAHGIGRFLRVLYENCAE